MLNRRRFAATAAAGIVAQLVSSLLPAAALANVKNLRLIVGFAPGGVADSVARLLAEHMKGYAPSLVVDNRAGAGGRIALEALKAADADGSVMALTPVDQLALFPHIYTHLGYKPTEDFAPVSGVCSMQFLLVVGRLVPAHVKSLAQFIAWCRENPQQASYGTPGLGTHPHFLAVEFANSAGFAFTHVAYKGGATAVQDVLAGHLAACISTITTVLPHIQAGAVRALATTAPERSVALPDVPTFRQAGYPALQSLERLGVLVPARTPATVVTALHEAISRALSTEEVRSGLAKLAIEPAESTPAEFARLLALETRRWAEVVKDTGFTPLD